MIMIKRTRLAAAASALSLGLLSGGAQAFAVDWQWEADTYGLVTKDIHIVGEFNPSGMVMIEALQTSTGDIIATSIVDTVGNVQPGRQSSNALHAVKHLPAVTSSATAIGNNLSIEAATMAEFYVDQLAQNRHYHRYHGGQAEISAASYVSDVSNASASSAATAAANNLNVEACVLCSPGRSRAGGVETDLVVIGNLIQDSRADVIATSIVEGVALGGYLRLGRLDGPTVSSTATAIGNNASISAGLGH